MKNPVSRGARAVVAAITASFLLPVTAAAVPVLPGSSSLSAELSSGKPAVPEPSWVGSWSAAQTPPGEEGTVSGDGFTDTTLRQTAHLSIGGDSLRLRVSNEYGEEPLEIGAATVAPGSATGEIDPAQVQDVTFDRNESVTIPPGEEWLSDPLHMGVEPNSNLVVSLHLPGPTGPATTHPLGMATSYRASGDATGAETAEFEELDDSRYFLSGVDVSSAAQGSVVFFGDSITDGHSSTVDANLRYPDQVADRLLERPEEQQCGVLNSGISGNHLLRDDGTKGVAAMSRFEEDVLNQPGVHTVVLLEGINDIGNSEGEVEPEELIEVYRQFIEQAHDHGIRVVGATMTPYEDADYYTEAGEADRLAVNEWIRNSGEFDDIVDYEAAVRDPEQPSRLLPEFDPGDKLHPNDQGYAAMAEQLNLETICAS
ncbi:SGNH/GDSL hydrolase family protein [Corynebacterium halotolerans]|uniref:SGNH/GDSL hydrolase family protein n=1 Tax=Corynebacterium halotolerans TaxID=225326 RepID=UPI003CE91F48